MEWAILFLVLGIALYAFAMTGYYMMVAAYYWWRGW